MRVAHITEFCIRNNHFRWKIVVSRDLQFSQVVKPMDQSQFYEHHHSHFLSSWQWSYAFTQYAALWITRGLRQRFPCSMCQQFPLNDFPDFPVGCKWAHCWDFTPRKPQRALETPLEVSLCAALSKRLRLGKGTFWYVCTGSHLLGVNPEIVAPGKVRLAHPAYGWACLFPEEYVPWAAGGPGQRSKGF